MDPEEKEKMEKRDWLAEKIQMLNTQLEGFEADVEKAVSTVSSCRFYIVPRPAACASGAVSIAAAPARIDFT